MAQMRLITCAALAGAAAFTLTAPAAAQRSKAGPVDKRPMTQAQTTQTPRRARHAATFSASRCCSTRRAFRPERSTARPVRISSTRSRRFRRRGSCSQRSGRCADCATVAGARRRRRGRRRDHQLHDHRRRRERPVRRNDPARRCRTRQACPALGYTSLIEKLAERFHTSPAMLQQLNPGARFDGGHGRSRSPRSSPSTPMRRSRRPIRRPADFTVKVSKDESALRVTRADGTLVFFAPVTTGSEKDPLPPGDWKVNGVSWKPTFNYNPDLFWDAKPGDAKATLKPGPNNPVGIVWIDINVDHYGIHGTPEPGRVGHAESHGCVRLTNWDAARLAALVKPGTPVQFR